MGGEGDPEHKAVKKLLNEAVDQAVYLWFMQKRSIGQPISGPLLCEKALDFSIKLGGSSNFRASTGWLQKFKKRHWIREIEIHGEKLSASESSASKFQDEMKSYLEQQGYKDEFIYNADETGLYWKSLPRRSLASRAEDAAPGHKVSKERVTIMICANASGTHRIPLLLIGKSKKPRSFKNTRNLPVVYSSQRKAWMNSEIFIDWFKKTFIPEVKKYQDSVGQTGKVLLLIDNAPSHPCTESLSKIDETVEARFLPPNSANPADGSGRDKSVQSIIDVYSKTTLKDCCYMIAGSWSSVRQSTLRSSWNNILARRELSATSGASDLGEVVEEVLFNLNTLSLSGECQKADIEAWLACDSGNPGFQMLDDDEIAESVLNVEDEMDEDFDTQEAQVACPSHEKAFRCLEVALEWLEWQEECDPDILIPPITGI
ncbi:hypothetical protein M514_07271 [Trichuris suis]|uniref:HTH CENPB-type domain-containing protein n=1 Tax=Trichuris suis TaxID=68888 RepID=A0A085N1J4_9BILA|nr:hypothetical protein M514_07271 [Trichuris suis]